MNNIAKTLAFMNRKTKRILEHIKKYLATGKISDSLVPYYNQHGNWIGTPGLLLCAKRHAPFDRITSSYLPLSRRTYRDRSGTILRTSYVSIGDDSVLIKYSGINGSLVVQGNSKIHAPSLRHIGGGVIISTNQRVYLPNLKTVGRCFEVLQTFGLHVPRLIHVGGMARILGCIPPRLTTVGKSLAVHWCISAESESLRLVGGSLTLDNAEAVNLAELEFIGGSFIVSHFASVINTPKLQGIGGDFLAKSVPDLRTPALRLVGGNMDTSSAKLFYRPRIKVCGTWIKCPGDLEYWKRREATMRLFKENQIWI